MSHTAQFETEIRSLDLAQITARALGFDLNTVAQKQFVDTYYDGNVAVDACFEFPGLEYLDNGYNSSHGFIGRKGRNKAIGLKRTEKGTYSFVFDAWSICASNERSAIGEKFGTLGKWKEGEQKDSAGNVITGHISVGTAHVFMHEYVCQTAELYARSTFMNSERRHDNASGQTTIILTGGNLLPGEEIHVIAHADGTSTMAAVGFTGSRCKVATSPLESILGVQVNDELLGDYYHTVDGEHLKVEW